MPPSFEIADLNTWKRMSGHAQKHSGLLRFLTHCNTLERSIDNLEESFRKFGRSCRVSPHEGREIKGEECGSSIVIRLSGRCGGWCGRGCDERRPLRLDRDMGALFIQDLEAARNRSKLSEEALYGPLTPPVERTYMDELERVHDG